MLLFSEFQLYEGKIQSPLIQYFHISLYTILTVYLICPPVTEGLLLSLSVPLFIITYLQYVYNSVLGSVEVLSVGHMAPSSRSLRTLINPKD